MKAFTNAVLSETYMVAAESVYCAYTEFYLITFLFGYENIAYQSVGENSEIVPAAEVNASTVPTSRSATRSVNESFASTA